MKLLPIMERIMTIKNLCENVRELTNQTIKVKLYSQLKSLFYIIEQYENSKEIRKNEFDKIDTLKKYIKHFIDEQNRDKF